MIFWSIDITWLLFTSNVDAVLSPNQTQTQEYTIIKNKA